MLGECFRVAVRLCVGLMAMAVGICVAVAEPAVGAVNPDPPRSSGAGARQTNFYRHYSVCAQVTLFGIPVFSRCGVGGAFAELSRPDEDEPLWLKFVSGSSPERAHGLNRLGLILESVRESKNGPITSSYFGFITANNEESVSQGRRALEESGRSQDATYSVAEGLIKGSSMSYTTYRIELPSRYRWSDASQMLAEVRQQLKGQPANRHTLDASEAAGAKVELRTFLYAVRSALVSASTKGDEYVVHNGKLFQLTWSKSHDTRAQQEFVRAGLAGPSCTAMRMSAVIRNVNSGEQTPFAVWYDASSQNVLPLRFEFRARSFLKLVFQADPHEAAPPDLEMRASVR